jgi:hypothetical protein
MYYNFEVTFITNLKRVIISFTFANRKGSQYGTENGPIGDEVGRAQSRDGCQKLSALP